MFQVESAQWIFFDLIQFNARFRLSLNSHSISYFSWTLIFSSSALELLTSVFIPTRSLRVGLLVWGLARELGGGAAIWELGYLNPGINVNKSWCEFKLFEKAWESMTVHESLKPNEKTERWREFTLFEKALESMRAHESYRSNEGARWREFKLFERA